jgi:hypothetical protein
MLGDADSAFWFYGRLHPAARVPPFQAEEVEVVQGVRLEVIWDGIGVWSMPGTRSFKSPREASELFGLVAGAYALLARSSFTVSSDGWVEARKASLDGSILGFQAQQMTSAEQVRKDSEESVCLRAACETAVVLRAHPNYRLAIADVHGALRAPGSDAFFYAYRAIESVARATAEGSGSEDADWAGFHRRVGIDPDEGKEKLEPLRQARNALAHGDPDAQVIHDAERKRERLIDLARWFVITAIDADEELAGPDLSRYLPEL